MGTKEGLLEQLYASNEFTTADNNFIEAHDDDDDDDNNNNYYYYLLQLGCYPVAVCPQVHYLFGQPQ